MFLSVKQLSDDTIAPFENYIFVSMDYGNYLMAYEIAEDQKVDLDDALNFIFRDIGSVDIDRKLFTGDRHYAKLIIHGYAPNDHVCFDAVDFYLNFYE